MDALEVKPMTRQMYTYLTERGKLFAQVALGHHYLYYDRFLIYKRDMLTHIYKKVDGWDRLMWGLGWGGVEWSGVEWSGVEWSGVEWSGVEWSEGVCV